MGDTGSLGLGGAIAGLAVMTKTEVLLILLGGIFVIEALSVVIQVISFQMTRKRVFLMAPIHHHFELKAWSETKIILRFWIVASICAAIGFTIYRQSRGVSGEASRRGRRSEHGCQQREHARPRPAGEGVARANAPRSARPAAGAARGPAK